MDTARDIGKYNRSVLLHTAKISTEIHLEIPCFKFNECLISLLIRINTRIQYKEKKCEFDSMKVYICRDKMMFFHENQ